MPWASTTDIGGRTPPSRAPQARVTTAMHTPATAKRAAAPVNGGTERRPILIASQVLPQITHSNTSNALIRAALGAREAPSCVPLLMVSVGLARGRARH